MVDEFNGIIFNFHANVQRYRRGKESSSAFGYTFLSVVVRGLVIPDCGHGDV